MLHAHPNSRLGNVLPPSGLYTYMAFQAPPSEQIEYSLVVTTGLYFVPGGFRYGACGDFIVMTLQQLLGVALFHTYLEVSR